MFIFEEIAELTIFYNSVQNTVNIRCLLDVAERNNFIKKLYQFYKKKMSKQKN